VTEGAIELSFDNHVFTLTFDHDRLHTVSAGSLIAALQEDWLSGFKVKEMLAQGALEVGSLWRCWFYHIKYSK
jgi:hypothetical protein